MLDFKRIIASVPKKPKHVALQPLFTPWGERIAQDAQDDLSEILTQAGASSTHPHPQFEREHVLLLNGWWEYCIVAAPDAESAWSTAPLPCSWESRIRVPFSPEAPLSGVNRQLKPDELLWYRRLFTLPSEFSVDERRIFLHFEAVDYACACYCNGSCVGTHVGGYLPFSFDITESLVTGENELSLCVFDPSSEGVQLRGKQHLQRGGIWYTAQSGIWQTVWLEAVPRQHIASLKIEAQADSGQVSLTVITHDWVDSDTFMLKIRLFDAQDEVYGTAYDAGGELDPNTLSAQIYAPAPSRNPTAPLSLFRKHSLILTLDKPRLWSPEDPHLYRLELSYGEDKVASYCALRTITVEPDEQGVKRLCINHQPYFLRGVLDQGYWPDGLMTAPSDDALVFDIQAMKDLGFNLLRKHIKIECDRWYYHCDRLGMLVWQDMVSGGSPLSSWHSSYKPTFFRRSWNSYADNTPHHYKGLSSESSSFRAEWTQTCCDTIAYLSNHPSIVTWVLFNEGWGQFEANKASSMVSGLDPTRPLDAVSGWYDQGSGDFLSVHNYFRPLEVYRDTKVPPRAFVISECGGCSWHIPTHSSLPSSYGYESFSDLSSFKDAVRDILAQLDKLEHHGLAGFVYTQLSDIEEETNGILTYDRRINKLTDKDPT